MLEASFFLQMKFVQVAGHKNLISKDFLVYKKFDQTECDFYQKTADLNLPWIPKYYGKCNGRCFEDLANSKSLDNGACHIILENLIYNLKSPVLADIKLGSVLYDHNASEEKKARMILKSRSSTSSSLSLRICGVYTPEVQLDSKFGYSLTAEDFVSRGLTQLLNKVSTEVIKRLIAKVKTIRDDYYLLNKLECYSSSLFIIIQDEEVDIRLIDFCHSFVKDHHVDKNVLDGLEFMIALVTSYLELYRR